MQKVKKVLIEGRLKLEQWTDQNGNKRSKHSITCESFEFLDPKGTTSGNDYNMPQDNSYQNNQNSQSQNNNNQYQNQNQNNNYNQQQSMNQQGNAGQNFNNQNNFSNPAPSPTPNTMSGTPNFEIDDDDIPF